MDLSSYEKLNALPPEKRLKKTKRQVLSLLFRPSFWKGKKYQWLVGEFPNVMGLVIKINKGFIKTNNGRGKMKKRKHDLSCPLAFVLQTLEATLILDKVCANLLNKYEIPLFTIHDCIATTEEHIDKVEEEIATVYEEYLGAKPSIKLIKDWKLD